MARSAQNRHHRPSLRLTDQLLPPSCSTAVGVVYPAYASFKAVEVLRVRNDTSEASRWLVYWGIYGAVSALERVLDRALPW